jgi:CRP-like cAMP-binding protein
MPHPTSASASVTRLADHRAPRQYGTSKVGRQTPDTCRLVMMMSSLAGSITTPRAAQPGEIIVDSAQADDFLALLTSGIVIERVVQDTNVFATDLCTAGDFLGQIDRGPHRTHVQRYVASTDATYSLIARTALLTLIDENPRAAAALARREVGRRVAFRERLLAVNTQRPAVRLARCLIELDRTYAAAQYRPRHAIPLSQRDIGALAGIAYSSVYRLIADFRKKGILETEHAWVFIADQALLYQAAGIAWSKTLTDLPPNGPQDLLDE